MLSLLPLLTLALSALMVNAAPAPAQVECKPAFRGPLTLYRYRQVPQGLGELDSIGRLAVKRRAAAVRLPPSVFSI